MDTSHVLMERAPKHRGNARHRRHAGLDANQMAEKEEYEAKQKELEAVVNPILAALGGGAGAGGMPGGMPGGTYAASVSELSELQGRVDGVMGSSP